MTRYSSPLVLLCFLFPVAAMAQTQGAMNHGAMNHDAMMMHTAESSPNGVTEGGQAAFAAIAEIVARLAADPSTDWSKVNIEALRQHLIDMDNVTLRAQVTTTSTQTGAKFEVWADDPSVRASIQRMVAAHTATMNGVNGWALTSASTNRGATLEVAGKSADSAMIQGLGFIGVMALGTHHQAHHLGIALGQNMHG